MYARMRGVVVEDEGEKEEKAQPTIKQTLLSVCMYSTDLLSPTGIPDFSGSLSATTLSEEGPDNPAYA